MLSEVYWFVFFLLFYGNKNAEIDMIRQCFFYIFIIPFNKIPIIAQS